MTTSIVPRTTFPLLAKVRGPDSLRGLTKDELIALSHEIRAFLVSSVTATGGHLGPNLGVVELTLALHRVFGSPADTLLFDTGHQGYVHKLLTGRMDGFTNLRQAGGLSGYPSRAESPHDVIENSHASTALAYADGLAKARQLAGGRSQCVVAVIGDGALTGGMAWEALNNIGGARRPVVVVLNDNSRSYAPTVGSVAEHLRTLRARSAHPFGRSNIFESLGFAYLGPVDGHNLLDLEEALRQARALSRPVVVHAVTVKGKGYEPAEADTAEHMHAIGVIDPVTGQSRTAPGSSTWTDSFAEAMAELGTEQHGLVAVTAAMGGPTGLARFASSFPDRFFDVGIAEQHAVTSAAGLAMGGAHPVVAIYATFLNRGFDQILMDVALHRLPVTFVLDRSGVTGPDGPSHHGMWDLALLSTVPGMRVAVPRDAAQLHMLLREAVTYADGPTALRFPKAPVGKSIPSIEHYGPLDILARSGEQDVLLLAVGPMGEAAVKATEELVARGMGVTVVDPRWALPVSRQVIELASHHRVVVTVEDGIQTAGVGSAVSHAMRESGIRVPVHTLGLPHRFLEHDTRGALLAAAGLTSRGIAAAVTRACALAGLAVQEDL